MGVKVYTTASPKETQDLGKKLAKALSLSKGKTLKDKRILCLYGELGSGKTTFIQGLAGGLGIKKRIISPTFILVREYDINRKRKLYHIDCYRLNDLNQFINIGGEEIIEGNNIIAIEWAEKIRKILPKKRIDIKFENIGENKRKIAISYE